MKKDIVNFAVQKLSGPPDDIQIRELAALAVRVIIEFEPTRRDTFPSSPLGVEARLVQASGRLVLSVPQHREYMRTAYGSEPIFAEAAAKIMHQRVEENTQPDASYWARVVNRNLAPGSFNKGPNGDLAMRLLLTCAYDIAVQTGGVLHDELIQHDRPVKLVTFLTALLGTSHHKVLDSRPSNERHLLQDHQMTLRERFKNASVRFTHFMRAGSPEIVKDQSMWPALVRGFAYQCCDGQNQIDIIIPILLDSDGVLGASNVSALVIQVKNTTQALHPHIDIASTCQDGINFFSKEDGRAYIAMTANLGTADSDVTVTSPGERDSSRGHENHARYAFEIKGCNPSSYHFIKDVAPWDILLNKRKLLDEHPHRDERLQCVRRMCDLVPEIHREWAVPVDAGEVDGGSGGLDGTSIPATVM